MTKEKFYLNCPFEEKDMCKRIGGRWDSKERKWYVPTELDPKQFKRWWPAKGTLEVTKVKPNLYVVK